MKLLAALGGLVGGFFVGAGAAALLVTVFSGNVHDKALETVMTAAFVGGPIGGVIGAVLGIVAARRRR